MKKKSVDKISRGSCQCKLQSNEQYKTSFLVRIGKCLPDLAKALENKNHTGNCVCEAGVKKKPGYLITGLKGRQINAL